MRTRLSLGAALGLTLLALALGSSPAHAQTFRAEDSTHDVNRLDLGSCQDNSCPDETAAPNVGDVDVVRMAANYRPHSLTIALHTRQPGPGSHVPFVGFWLRPEHGPLYGFQVRVLPDGTSRVAGQRAFKRYRCPGADPVALYADRSWKLTVPASCLGSPASIRVAAVAFRVNSGAAVIHADDALDPQPTHGRRPTFSDPIRRG